MKMNTSIARAIAATGCIALGLFVLSPVVCRGQTTPSESQSPADLPSAANDALKLTKAGMSEEIILGQLRNVAAVQLTTDQIIYLSKAGVSQTVIKALLQGGSQAPTQGAPAAPAGSAYPGVAGAGAASAPASYPQAAPASAAPAYPPAQSAPQAAPNPPSGYPSATPQPPVQPGEVSIAVPANIAWIDSGIDLSPGVEVSITAGGIVNVPQRFSIIPSNLTPDGYAAFPSINLFHPFVAPGLPAWSLVGKVTTYGAPFKIGSNSTVVSPVGGRLFLSVNANSFAANTGSWTVTVTLPQAALSGPPPVVDFDYFHDELAPYGNWVQVPGYGLCWNPTASVQDPSWRPYANDGQWAYTDAGLYWQSEYPWGDVAFHYGRWTYGAGYGWLWVPGYDWAPAWVAWRHAEAEGFTGWAPLPPSAEFVAGIGLRYNGVLAVDVDFGMPAEAFVFVGYDHFWEHNYRGFFLGRERAAYFYSHSVVRNGYRLEGGRLMVEGLGRDRLGAVTRRDIRVEDARGLRAREETAHFDARRTDPKLTAAQRGKLTQKRPAPQAKQAGKTVAKPAAKPTDKKTN